MIYIGSVIKKMQNLAVTNEYLSPAFGISLKNSTSDTYESYVELIEYGQYFTVAARLIEVQNRADNNRVNYVYT